MVPNWSLVPSSRRSPVEFVLDPQVIPHNREMADQSHQIVQKLRNCCNVLRDDGMSYGDYVEQLTYLLFLKMADERTKPPYNESSAVPAEYSWPTLIKKDGDELICR